MLIAGARTHDYGKYSPEEGFERIKDDGFDAIMLAFQKAIKGVDSYYDVNDELITKTKQAIDKAQLKLNTLGVYMDLGYVDESKRSAAVDQFKKGISVAANMGVPNVSTETTQYYKQPEVSKEEALKALYRSVEDVLPEAEEKHICICLEPVYYHTLYSAEVAKKLIDDFKSPNICITYDPVNLLSPDVDDQYKLWDSCMELLRDYIKIIHIKGVKRQGTELVKTDLHESIVDYKYLFKQFKNLPDISHRDIHIIREETDPNYGKKDADFIKNLCS